MNQGACKRGQGSEGVEEACTKKVSHARPCLEAGWSGVMSYYLRLQRKDKAQIPHIGRWYVHHVAVYTFQMSLKKD